MGERGATLDAHFGECQYENRKDVYFEAVWNLWNWNDVSEHLLAARRLDNVLPGSAA